ncbi:MAG: LamG-like jellyroll fold domain-containing protein, partial [Bacteroidota bacterium]
ITIVPGDVVDLENPFETPSPRTDGRMGSGLAIEGDYAFAGAGGCNTNNQSEAADAGEGYIFRRNLTANQWEYVSTVQPTAPIAKQGFGGVADLSGNYLIVGNCRHLENTSASASDVAAYIFKGNGDTWAQHAKLDNASATKAFGAAVAIDGDYAVVGDYLYDSESGWIHLYKRNGDTWTLVESLDGSINDATDFGRAVAIDDGYVAVGMKEAYGSGGVSVYPIGDDGFGAEVSLTPFDDNLANDTQNMDFGHAVALSGRWLLVGADDADDDRGAAFIFYRNDDGSWSRRQKLQPDNLQDNSGGAGTGDDFGWSVGINDDVAIIGVPDRDTFRGQVYLYRYNGEVWVEQQQLIASDRVPNDKFGYTVAIDQARAVIGVPQRTVGSSAEAGAIFINEVVSAPDAVAASDGTLSNRVQVSWTDDAINEEKYLIYRDGALLQEVGANATSYNDTDASAGTVHLYCVAAFKERDGASAQVCDPGWRPADGAISGRIASQQGAGIQGVDVCAVPSADSPLAAGGALLFDGLGSGIVVGNEAAYDFSSTPGYTVELWINAAEENFAEHAPYHLISQWGSGGAGNAAYVLALREDLNVSISNHTGSTNHSVNSGGLITPGEWVHVAGTFDSATNELRIYINGVLQGTTTDASAPQRSDIYDLMFGVEPSGGNEFRGLMDEIRIWNVARTEAQILAAMKVPLTGDEDNLVGYWPIQQGGGNVVGNFTQNGLHGTANPGVYWTSEAAPLNDCTATDSDGNYQLLRIRYGEQTAFQVTPTDAIRQFQPPVKSISLTTASPVQNEVNFTDVSAYTVSGVVQYAGTTVDGNAFTCPVEGVQMLLDGVFRSESEADGAFAVPAGLGTRTLTAELETQAENGDVTVVHSFTPAQHTLDVQGDLFNINFVDDTRRPLVLNVQGGCGHSIGTATVRVTTANSCFTSDVALSSGTPTVLALPPQAYQVQVLDVQDVPAGLDRADILAFFDALGVQDIDLTATAANAPDTLTLTYRAPATLSISGFEAKDQLSESTCAAGAPLSVLDDKGNLLQTLPHVPVLFGQSGETTQPIPMTIKLVEQYGTESCAVEGVTVSVLDQINDQGAPIELITNAEGIAVYQEDQGTLPNNTAGPSAGDRYQTYANTSNVTEGLVVDGVNRSFQKALTASVNIEGRDQLSETAWAVVLGRRTRTGTFSTLPTIDVPMHVLRDPPGDASFSYLTKGESVCQNYGFEGAFTLSGATDLKIETGLEFEAGFFGFTTETDVEVSPGFEHSLSGTITSGGTWETCLTLGSTISTSDAATFIGEAADVFVGVGTNFKLALSDKLEATAACEIELSEVASVGFDEDKAFETVYTYTRGQIENTIIPTLEGLKATDSDHEDRYQDGIDSWEAQLAYDEIEKKAVANACSDLEGTLRNQPKADICANLIEAKNTTLDALQTDVMEQCTTNLSGDDSDTTSACEGLVDPVIDQLRNNLSPEAQKENRSFDAGASYSYTHTRDRITTFDFGVEVEFSNVWKYNVKSTAAGNGGELETSIGVT